MVSKQFTVVYENGKRLSFVIVASSMDDILSIYADYACNPFVTSVVYS